VSPSYQCTCTCSFSLPLLAEPTVAVNMPGTDQEIVLNPSRSSTATRNLQTDNDHKSSSMWCIANTCRLCAPACCPSQMQTRPIKATASALATLSNCGYANVRQSCSHGPLNPSRVGFMQQVGNKGTCFQSCTSYGTQMRELPLARYLACAA
jgi:hypothetical protein